MIFLAPNYIKVCNLIHFIEFHLYKYYNNRLNCHIVNFIGKKLRQKIVAKWHHKLRVYPDIKHHLTLIWKYSLRLRKRSLYFHCLWIGVFFAYALRFRSFRSMIQNWLVTISNIVHLVIYFIQLCQQGLKDITQPIFCLKLECQCENSCINNPFIPHLP